MKAAVVAIVVWLAGCGSCQVHTPAPTHQGRVAGGSETSVAVVPLANGGQSYVIAYIGGWAVSTDGGATWTAHATSDPGFDWGPAAENGITLSYTLDPTLVVTGNPGQVAFVSIAGGKDVAIAVSNDGGVHFGKVHLVSTESAIDPEPVSTFDPATGKIWVAWTGKTPTSHPIVRALHYDAAGTLTFDSDPISVDNLPGLADRRLEINMTIAAGTRDGKSHVAIAYADKYEDVHCPDQHVDDSYYNPLDLHYYLADSIDDARTWQTTEIVHDRAWPQCVTDNPLGGSRYNRNRPAVAFAGNLATSFYVALPQSSPTGSLVHVYRVDYPFGAGKVHDFYSNPPADRKRHDQFGPALAVGYSLADTTSAQSTAMNLMVTWHDTRNDPNGNIQQVVYGETIGLLAWEGVLSTPTGANGEHVPWTTSDGFWGDYEGVAVDNVNHWFVAAWGDNRMGGATAVWAAVIR